MKTLLLVLLMAAGSASIAFYIHDVDSRMVKGARLGTSIGYSVGAVLNPTIITRYVSGSQPKQ